MCVKKKHSQRSHYILSVVQRWLTDALMMIVMLMMTTTTTVVATMVRYTISDVSTHKHTRGPITHKHTKCKGLCLLLSRFSGWIWTVTRTKIDASRIAPRNIESRLLHLDDRKAPGTHRLEMAGRSICAQCLLHSSVVVCVCVNRIHTEHRKRVGTIIEYIVLRMFSVCASFRYRCTTRWSKWMSSTGLDTHSRLAAADGICVSCLAHEQDAREPIGELSGF